MRLSNKFTLVRIVFAPIFLLLFFLPSYLNNTFNIDTNLFNVVTGWALIPLLGFAEFTDFLDGFYARKRGEVSDFGKLFDPFADVFLHISVLASFTVLGKFNFICIILIIWREITMNFLRMVATKKGVAIAARKGGKFKTCLYIFTGFVLLAVDCIARIGFVIPDQVINVINIVIIVLGWLCVAAAYVSFIDYIKNFGTVLKDEM